MNTKNFWKIMGGGQLILTDCPDTFKDAITNTTMKN